MIIVVCGVADVLKAAIGKCQKKIWISIISM
jgi:hypothetical protein